MKIQITKLDINEMVYKAVRNILQERAGVADTWYPLFEYIGNKIYDDLSEGSFRLKDKLRKDGSVLHRGERRGKNDTEFHIDLDKLKELSPNGRLVELFPNGITVKTFEIKREYGEEIFASIQLEKGIINVGLMPYQRPIATESTPEGKQNFIKSLASACMHEITHGLNGPDYAKNDADKHFERGVRDDYEMGGFSFESKSAQEVAKYLFYFFNPGEMNARVSGFYYGMIDAFEHASKDYKDTIGTQEGMQKDIMFLSKSTGDWRIDDKLGLDGLRPAGKACNGTGNPDLLTMRKCIEYLKNEKYEKYKDSLDRGRLRSLVACLLTYPTGYINVRKYGKIFDKGGKAELDKNAVADKYNVAITVTAKPEDGYHLEGRVSPYPHMNTVYDKDGNKVGNLPNDYDVFERDENGEIVMHEEPSIYGSWWKKDPEKTTKKAEDIAVTAFTRGDEITREDLLNNYTQVGGEHSSHYISNDNPNISLYTCGASYSPDKYHVPTYNKRSFSSKIVDEQSFEAIKMDMVRQLTNTYNKFLNRIIKVYYMAVDDFKNKENNK